MQAGISLAWGRRETDRQGPSEQWDNFLVLLSSGALRHKAGTHGDRTLSTKGPGFLKPANVPCDVETETRQLSSDPECLESEDAGSEHGGLKIKESSLLQALCKPSPHPRLQCSPMREKELR